MGFVVPQNNVGLALPFYMADSTDHRSPLTGLTPSVQIAKAASAFGTPVGSVNETGNGWYWQQVGLGDADTLGPLILRAVATGADDANDVFPVVAYNAFDAVRLGLSALPNAAAAAAGGLITRGTGAGQLDVSGGKVDLVAAAITAILTGTTLAEGYPADGATASVAELLYLILALVGQYDVSGTSLLARKLDGTSVAAGYTLDDATNPTARVRTA